MDARISFRAGAPLRDALALRASKSGATVSDYIRSILREHVAQVSEENPPPINITVNPAQSVHELASRGDADAFAELAGWHYQRGLNGVEPQVIAYSRASDYARLAMIGRGARQDWLNHIFLLEALGGALMNAGLGALATQAIGESVALAETMADEGDEEMAGLVASGASNVAPEALSLARDLREKAKDALHADAD